MATRTTHIVLALDEVNIVLVAAKERQECAFKVFGYLTFPVIVDGQRRFHPGAIGQYLKPLRLVASTLAQVPVFVIWEEPL